jgi:hypothetical protein
MRFKDFITRQRATIFLVGLIVFAISILTSLKTGFATMWGELFIDLAASAITIIFTSLIIDYLSVREKASKTKNAAGLAEEEIRVTCFRMKWSMARLFGLERQLSGRNKISNRTEAREYLDRVGQEVTTYLKTKSMEDAPLVVSRLPKYLERLQTARIELEQTLILYEYAMDYRLKERVLNLRTELQISENILGFIDFSEDLNEANISLIRIQSQAVSDEIERVLEHDSRIVQGTQIREKKSRLK